MKRQLGADVVCNSFQSTKAFQEDLSLPRGLRLKMARVKNRVLKGAMKRSRYMTAAERLIVLNTVGAFWLNEFSLRWFVRRSEGSSKCNQS